MDLHCDEQSLPIPLAAPLPIQTRTPFPSASPQPPTDQPHLAALREKPRTAVRIVTAADEPQQQPNSATINRRRRARRRIVVLESPSLQLFNAPVTRTSPTCTSAQRNTSAAAVACVSFCYAVALRAAKLHHQSDRECLQRPGVYCVQLHNSHALSPHLAQYTTKNAHRVKGPPAERTFAPNEEQQGKGPSGARPCTRASSACHIPIPGSEYNDDARPLNPAHAQPRNQLLMFAAARTFTPPVLLVCLFVHLPSIAQSHITAHTPRGLQICTPSNLSALYIQCSPPTTPNYSYCCAKFNI